MNSEDAISARVAIACGGTGGHLFPGLAVAAELQNRGATVTLLVSPKDIDQLALKTAPGFRATSLPAVGLTGGNGFAFVRGFWRSLGAARRLFNTESPEAVLAMGGFTSAPPMLAGKLRGAALFLHESNAIPGRANRWLSRIVNQAFVGFGEAVPRLHARSSKITGTPVRPQFKTMSPAECRVALGLDPNQPVLLVTGGSQGATGLNDLILGALPILVRRMPGLQLFHLAGPRDQSRVEAACKSSGIRAVVHGFFPDVHLALGAATAVVSRAGASSLAELSAMQTPAILVPYPSATDNHQYYNALAFEKTGAALLLIQSQSTPESVAAKICALLENPPALTAMSHAMRQWHAPQAAESIAESILRTVSLHRRAGAHAPAPAAASSHLHQSART